MTLPQNSFLLAYVTSQYLAFSYSLWLLFFSHLNLLLLYYTLKCSKALFYIFITSLYNPDHSYDFNNHNRLKSVIRPSFLLSFRSVFSTSYLLFHSTTIGWVVQTTIKGFIFDSLLHIKMYYKILLILFLSISVP